MSERQKVERLLPMGHYSHGFVLPRWWLRLNDDPEVVKIPYTLDAIRIEPVARTSTAEKGAESDDAK